MGRSEKVLMSKIAWTDMTWNPIWGCLRNCPYCYAKGIAKRFAQPMAEKNAIFDWNTGEMFDDPDNVNRNEKEIEGNLKEFKPTFLGYNFEWGITDVKLLKANGFPKKSTKRIFIGSMTDIAYWKPEWIERVVSKIMRYPLHTFQILTKSPSIYKKLDKIMPPNVIFGVTVTKQEELKRTAVFAELENRTRFVSFEPLLSDIKDEPLPKKNPPFYETYFDGIDWVILGTMSGRNRTPAKIEWFENIIDIAENKCIAVFVKQIEINGKIEKNNFPKQLQLRQFPEDMELPF